MYLFSVLSVLIIVEVLVLARGGDCGYLIGKRQKPCIVCDAHYHLLRGYSIE